MPRKIAVARGKFQVYLLESLEQFAELKTVWLDLERQTDQPCFFQSYAWCGHVAEVLMRTLPDRYTPLVAYATQDGVPVALWPLSRQKRSGTWQLRPIDDPFGQFSGILGRDADAIIALVAATLLMVRERKLADAVRLEFVLAGSPLECALQQSGLRSRGEVGAPYLDTRLWPSIAELKASRNKKTMKNLRNSNNRLSKAGAYEHRYETDKDRDRKSVV